MIPFCLLSTFHTSLATILPIGLLLTFLQPVPLPSAPGLRVPPGFVVTEFADSKLANDILSMTVDPRGASSSPARATFGFWWMTMATAGPIAP